MPVGFRRGDRNRPLLLFGTLLDTAFTSWLHINSLIRTTTWPKYGRVINGFTAPRSPRLTTVLLNLTPHRRHTPLRLSRNDATIPIASLRAPGARWRPSSCRRNPSAMPEMPDPALA